MNFVSLWYFCHYLSEIVFTYSIIIRNPVLLHGWDSGFNKFIIFNPGIASDFNTDAADNQRVNSHCAWFVSCRVRQFLHSENSSTFEANFRWTTQCPALQLFWGFWLVEFCVSTIQIRPLACRYKNFGLMNHKLWYNTGLF